MKTTYLVWKDPACNGINPDWKEITGKEFLALVRSLEKGKRFFVKLFSVSEDGSDGAVVMESTKQEYVKWRKEKDHSDWVREGQEERGHKVVSYHAMEAEDGCCGEELIGDIDDSYEQSEWKMLREKLPLALDLLASDELELLRLIYHDEKSLFEVAEINGISKQAVHKRLNKVLAKLRVKFF